jgi:chemotaxis protein MotB
MQDSGVRSDQVSQVRGYADQRLRLPKDPLDPSNRRISLIVQYIDGQPLQNPIPANLGKEEKATTIAAASAKDQTATLVKGEPPPPAAAKTVQPLPAPAKPQAKSSTKGWLWKLRPH